MILFDLSVEISADSPPMSKKQLETDTRADDVMKCDSRYSMTQYFLNYHPDYASCIPSRPRTPSTGAPPGCDGALGEDGALQTSRLNAADNGTASSGRSQLSSGRQQTGYKRHLFGDTDTVTLTSTGSPILPSSDDDHLHSTLVTTDSESTLNDFDLTSLSTVSMATTITDSAFQDGLAKLDANIAKLQLSLRASKLSSTQ